MTLLSICQQVAQDIPAAVPSIIVGNSDSTAMLILSQAQRAGEALARKATGGWVSMIREYDFTTAALGPTSGTIANTGPNGVAQITNLATTGSIAPLTWYGFGTGLPNNSIVASVDSPTQVTMNQPAVLQSAVGEFNFGQSDYPLPVGFQRPVDATMWDRSRFWAMRGPLDPQQWQLYKSSVIGRATIQRRFRFRYTNGQNVFSIDPVPTDNGSALVFEYVSNAWCESAAGVPQTTWQADTDVGVLDEYLIGLGTRWRVLRRLGLSFSEELDEYEREATKAMSQDGGAAILNLTPGNRLSLIGPWNLPETGFGDASMGGGGGDLFILGSTPLG